jgi:hypothetical protein
MTEAQLAWARASVDCMLKRLMLGMADKYESMADEYEAWAAELRGAARCR